MRTRRFLATAFSLTALAIACGSSSSSPSSSGGNGQQGTDAGNQGPTDSGAIIDSSSSGISADAAAIVAARPYALHVPAKYDKSVATPLVVMFHGYGASGAEQESYFQITATSDADTFLYAYGDGTLDQTNERFWNADDACCDLYHAGIDDVGYFDAIVADVSQKYNVDPKRIFVIGHSNGGFMSHRLACDRAGTVAAIVSLAGAVWNDPTKCTPSANIAIAEVHGDADDTIVYTGGAIAGVTYPAATTTVATWAAKNGCTGAFAANGQTLDLDGSLAGNETAVQTYAGCPAGIDVELWTIHGGAHIPALNHPGWGDAVWSFLSAHPKK